MIILTMFSLSVFALMGLQIYMGVLTQKCIKNFPMDGTWGNLTDENWERFVSNESKNFVVSVAQQQQELLLSQPTGTKRTMTTRCVETRQVQDNANRVTLVCKATVTIQITVTPVSIRSAGLFYQLSVL